MFSSSLECVLLALCGLVCSSLFISIYKLHRCMLYVIHVLHAWPFVFVPFSQIIQIHNCLTALCPGIPGWAGTRRNIHPLTSILITKHPLSTSSMYCNPHKLNKLFNLHAWQSFTTTSLRSALVFSWSGTLYLILHTFLHPIIIFSQSTWYYLLCWLIT